MIIINETIIETANNNDVIDRKVSGLDLVILLDIMIVTPLIPSPSNAMLIIINAK